MIKSQVCESFGREMKPSSLNTNTQIHIMSTLAFIFMTHHSAQRLRGSCTGKKGYKHQQSQSIAFGYSCTSNTAGNFNKKYHKLLN